MSNENNNQFEQPQENNQQYYQMPPQQQQAYYNQQSPNMPPVYAPEEKASVGLAILSYLIPLVGLILYLTKKDTKPKTAKVCGKCALASFIINIVISVIMYAVMGAAMFSAFTDDNSSIPDSSYSDFNEADENSVTADTPKSSNGAIGNYVCVVKSAELTKDYEGKDAVLITYEFTNNSSDSQSFDTALNDDVYQGGVGLEFALFIDGTETDSFDVKIKPGVTKEVVKGYVLKDTTTPLEVEISEWLSFNDEKITTTVELPQ